MSQLTQHHRGPVENRHSVFGRAAARGVQDSFELLSEVADRGFPLFLQAIFGSGCSEFGDCNLAICQVRARRRGAANPGRNPASAAQMKSLSNQPISLLSLFSERHYLAS